MAPDTMVSVLQDIWDNNPEYVEDGFKDYVCFFVDENDTSPTGCVFIDGYAYPICDYVLNRLDFSRTCNSWTKL